MAPRHIFFDFFGTLVTYERGPTTSLTRSGELIRSLAADMTDARIADEMTAAWEELEVEARQTLRELHLYHAMAVVLGRLSLRADTGFVQKFSDIYLEDWAESVHAVPGVREMIKRIDIRASVVSNTHHPLLVPREIERHGLEGLFDGVWTSVTHGYRKPHRSIYLRALESTQMPAEQVLFVGDNLECDYQGPRRVGMNALLVAPDPIEGVPEEHRIADILGLETWLSRRMNSPGAQRGGG